MIREGLKNVTAGANPMGIRKGMEKAVAVAVEELKAISKPIQGKDSIKTLCAGREKLGESAKLQIITYGHF